jgi:hypothetical protein
LFGELIQFGGARRSLARGFPSFGLALLSLVDDPHTCHCGADGNDRRSQENSFACFHTH